MLCPKAAQQLGGVVEGASMPLKVWMSDLALVPKQRVLVSHRYTSLHIVYEDYNGTASCDGNPLATQRGLT